LEAGILAWNGRTNTECNAYAAMMLETLTRTHIWTPAEVACGFMAAADDYACVELPSYTNIVAAPILVNASNAALAPGPWVLADATGACLSNPVFRLSGDACSRVNGVTAGSLMLPSGAEVIARTFNIVTINTPYVTLFALTRVLFSSWRRIRNFTKLGVHERLHRVLGMPIQYIFSPTTYYAAAQRNIPLAGLKSKYLELMSHLLRASNATEVTDCARYGHQFSQAATARFAVMGSIYSFQTNIASMILNVPVPAAAPKIPRADAAKMFSKRVLGNPVYYASLGESKQLLFYKDCRCGNVAPVNNLLGVQNVNITYSVLNNADESPCTIVGYQIFDTFPPTSSTNPVYMGWNNSCFNALEGEWPLITMNSATVVFYTTGWYRYMYTPIYVNPMFDIAVGIEVNSGKALLEWKGRGVPPPGKMLLPETDNVAQKKASTTAGAQPEH